MLDQPSVNGEVFNNTAVVSANEADSFNANDTEAETTTVRQRVDLRVTKAASASPVSLNQPFNWTITVVNNGPGNSAQTDLTDTLPAGVQVTGSAQAPRVRLYSEPALSETEQLSWLVLGRGPTGLGGADIGLLQSAAVALLSGEDSRGPSDQLIGLLGLPHLPDRPAPPEPVAG